MVVSGSTIFEAAVSGQMRLKCYDYAEYHRVMSLAVYDFPRVPCAI